MRALCLIRDQPWYRRSAFVNGLRAAGHEITHSLNFDRHSLLLIWNRYGGNHDLATRCEAAGGTVLVAENGYIGEGGGTPKFQVHPAGPQPNHYYALARSHHNGGGSWTVPLVDCMRDARLNRLGIELKPWREGGDYILVCPNRSFGIPGRMMHPDWAERCVERLRRITNKPVKIRKHPGNDEPKVSLAHDLSRASAVMIWSSSAGVHALVEGIPVVCEAPFWICKDAASHDCNFKRDDAARKHALQNLAWAQWTCAEIESGEPFRHLLPAAG